MHMSGHKNSEKVQTMKKAVKFGTLLSGILLVAVGCAQHREVTNIIPHNYEQRHPIIVGTHQKSLDVVLRNNHGVLDPADVSNIQAFAGEYHMKGHGAVSVQVPVEATAATHYRGPSKGAKPSKMAHSQESMMVKRATNMVRQALFDAGVSPSNIVMTAYTPANKSLPPVITVSFIKRGAQVATRCGQWPEDVGSGSFGSENRNYWNFGCATQQNLAAQVANPMDLVRPRHESPIYASRRSTLIESYRKSTTGAESGSSKSQSTTGAQ